MSLRVIDIVENPSLRTQLLAGESGVEHTIHWAHTCEDVNPWEWLGEGELVMMSGRSFPSDADGQVLYIRSMADARLAAIALAKDMGAPPLTDKAIAEANNLGFPILQTAYEVPWVLIARSVAEATRRTGQLTRIMRVYDTFRIAAQENLPDVDILRRLESETRAALRVIDLPTATAVIATGDMLPEPIAHRLMILAKESHLPGITRVTDKNAMHLILPIGRDREVLVASVAGDAPDLVVLQHIAAIVAVLAERSRARLSTRISTGMSVLSLLIQGRIDGDHAKERLAELDLTPGPWQVFALRSDTNLDPISILRWLAQDQPALVIPGETHLTIVVRAADSESIAAVATDSVAGARIGVSDVVHAIGQLPDAVREARWALETAHADGTPITYYGANRPLFLPRTLSEANEVVTQVLGDLMKYDEDHGTQLVSSLQVYFDSKRSWQTASKALRIHKQTLVYRMRRIEEITGRDLDDVHDVTELHLALRSQEILGRS